MSDFVVLSVLKSDEFSQSQRGYLAEDPATPLVRRTIGDLPPWLRPLARRLARREARALAAAAGVEGVPRLIADDAGGLVRTWIEGQPLHVARPADAAFYRNARRILCALHRAGITHNDAAKAQNWLMTPDGRAALIDFQLATVHRRKGRLFRLMAYEDLRHLLKQKRAFAPGLMTASERRMVERRSLPGRVWRATAKPAYELVTRRFLNWSDGEGQGGRLERDGPATEAALMAEPGVRAVALVPFARADRRAGLCAFCEAAAGMDASALAQSQRARGGSADLVVVAATLPRDARGALRTEILRGLLAEPGAPALSQSDWAILARRLERRVKLEPQGPASTGAQVARSPRPAPRPPSP